MVDVGSSNDLVGKSTAHTELADQLWQRDGDADYQLTLLEHQQKLQRCYAQCLKEGWSKEDMKSEQSMSWLTSNVAWRVEQAGKVEYDEDYFRLAYDDNVEAGVLIDHVRRAIDFAAAGAGAVGDAAGGGDASLKVSSVSDSSAQSPWMVPDDHDLQDTGGM